MTENILLICGSLNQTTQMHQIAEQFPPDYRCWFTPYYAEGLENLAARLGLLDFTVLGGRHRKDTLAYLAAHRLPVDPRGGSRSYDLVITCSDLIIQSNIRASRLVLVQEGITEPEGWIYQLVKSIKFLPRYLANTSVSGLSNAYDIFCVASEGYREKFIGKGVRPEKLAVTGIPNFDNLAENMQNGFPHREYVLVATTPYRESLRFENRSAFLLQCAAIAGNRAVIFKLHPTENTRRARREIKKVFPHALIFSRGNVNHMIANAAVVVTQQSTCTFVALALGKETHTYLDQTTLRRLMPIQNHGRSAARIASICLRLLEMPLALVHQARRGYQTGPGREPADLERGVTDR